MSADPVRGGFSGTRPGAPADRGFRDLLEAAPDAMVIVDREGRIVLVNSRAEGLFGYSRTELLGSSLEMLLPPRLRDAHRVHLQRHFAEPWVRPMGKGLDLLGMRKDGTEVPVEISLSPLETSQGRLAISAIRDVTERKRLERELGDGNLELENAGRVKDRSLGRSAERLSLLHEIDRAILAARSPEEIVEAVATRIHRLVACERAMVLRFDHVPERATVLAVSPAAETGFARGESFPLRILGDVSPMIDDLRRGDIHLLDLAAASPRTAEAGEMLALGVRHYVVLPILHQGALLGALSFRVRERDALSAEEREIGLEVAAQMAMAMQGAKQRLETEAAEARYRELFDTVPVGLYTMDPDGRVLSANPTAAEMLRYPDPAALHHVNPESALALRAEDHAEWLDRLWREGVVTGYEHRLRRRDGQVLWVRNNARAVRDSGGRVVRLEGTLEDITSSKQTQLQIAAQNATASALAEASDLGEALPGILRAICEGLEWDFAAFWLVDPDRAAIRCVDTWSAGGADTGELVTASRKTVLSPGKGIPGRVWASGEPLLIRDIRAEANLPRREALERDGLLGAFAFPLIAEGETLGVVEAFRRELLDDGDEPRSMTFGILGAQIAQYVKRWRAEEALRESERTLKNIFESLDRVFFSFDMRSEHITHISPACETVYGYPPEAFFRNPRLWRDVALPEDLPLAAGTDIPALRAGRPVTAQYRIRRADGEVRWVETHLKRSEHTGSTSTVDGMVTDVTERRLAEERLREALVSARESDRLKSAFLANISHEIRTPLNVIIGFIELLREELGDNEQRLEAVEAIGRASDRLINTVHAVLDVAQLESGSFHVRPAPIRLATLVAGRVARFEAPARKKGLTLSLEVGEPDAEVDFDEYCLTESIDRLLDNAVKFTPAGGITVRVHRDAGGCLLVEVRDTGIGIDEKYLPQLFQLFSQEDIGYTRRFEGSGLGLALTRRFLELNQARIDVESGKGKGSTFRIRFDPSSEVPAGRAAPRAEPSGRSVTGPAADTVLVVEDDEDSQRLLLRLLEGQVRLRFATSGSEARAVLADPRESVALVLMDISLRGPEDGLSLTRYIRGSEALRHLPVIATTAHALPRDRNRCLEAGCDAYVAKPFTIEELRSPVDRLAPGLLARGSGLES